MTLNPNAQKWVEALESGEFKQASMYLHKVELDGDEFCCLGVACKLAVDEGVIPKPKLNDYDGYDKYYVYGHLGIDNSASVLPIEVRDWLGLKSSTGAYLDRGSCLFNSLANQNDTGASFERIAEIIKNKPEGLFQDAEA